MTSSFSAIGVATAPIPLIPPPGEPVYLESADQFALVMVRLCWPDISEEDVREIALQLVKDVEEDLARE